MLALTGQSVLSLAAALAVAAVLGVGTLAWFTTRTASRQRRATVVGGVIVISLLGQALAVGATALEVNDQYGFYSDWADLLGSGPGPAPITTNGLLAPGEGSLELLTLRAPVGATDEKVLVWMPPGYDPRAPHPYPVVMFLPGQPSTPQMTLRRFSFASTASRLITEHRIAPFVAVFPTLMIAPPRDTECTDIPGGPRAETWLAHDVAGFVDRHFHVAPPGPGWSLLGWSTGAFCAAKILIGHPQAFGSAAAFGGYYAPLTDHTTGDLFGGDPRRYNANSPIWLYGHHGGLRGDRLLLIAGRQDRETWRATERMLFATAGDPAVSSIAFPRGGHNYHNYETFLAPALIWAARTWPR